MLTKIWRIASDQITKKHIDEMVNTNQLLVTS